jgi:hypothetical protein
MRHTTLTTLIVLLALIVGCCIGRELTRASKPPVANAQAAGGTMLMAASSTPNEAVCFLFNTATGQLTSYTQRGVGGLQLRGIRTCSADFNPKFLEFPKSKALTAVSKMKDLADQIAKNKKK